jgi:hypothetical protein
MGDEKRGGQPQESRNHGEGETYDTLCTQDFGDGRAIETDGVVGDTGSVRGHSWRAAGLGYSYNGPLGCGERDGRQYDACMGEEREYKHLYLAIEDDPTVNVEGRASKYTILVAQCPRACSGHIARSFVCQLGRSMQCILCGRGASGCARR